jgi:DedD protein
VSSLLYRDEEDQEPEITLSNASLVGLFLGLVLICGVFFGFGYSVGRRSTASAAIIPGNGMEAARSSERQPASPAASQGPALTEDTPAESSSTPARAAHVTLPLLQAQPETPPLALKASGVNPPAAAQQLKKPNPVQPRPIEAPAEAVRAMVQVAAVAHQEDADVLVSALRHSGFNAAVHNDAQDKLLHIQVGPFNSRAEANAARQQLLADGYNAIIKQ